MYHIIDGMFFRTIFTTGDVVKWTGSSRPTARSDIDLLIDQGFVRHLRGERPKVYFAPAILRAAYSEDED